MVIQSLRKKHHLRLVICFVSDFFYGDSIPWDENHHEKQAFGEYVWVTFSFCIEQSKSKNMNRNPYNGQKTVIKCYQ